MAFDSNVTLQYNYIKLDQATIEKIYFFPIGYVSWTLNFPLKNIFYFLGGATKLDMLLFATLRLKTKVCEHTCQ